MISHIKDIEDLKLPLNSKGDTLVFPRLIEDFSLNGEKLIREEIKKFLKDMDNRFRYSKGRTNNYYVNKTQERTIYKDRLNNN